MYLNTFCSNLFSILTGNRYYLNALFSFYGNLRVYDIKLKNLLYISFCLTMALLLKWPVLFCLPQQVKLSCT